MQKIATRIFICSSVVFGIVGIILVLTIPKEGEPNILLLKLLFSIAFVILPSFALSVGFKYLSTKS